MAAKKLSVIAFSGSLRKASYTTNLLRAFQKMAPDGISLKVIDIAGLPMINQDLESNLPKAVKNLHDEIEQADAVLLATPEYNRSYSPVLKNALDWGSRPEGENKWKKKPAAIIGCSPYSLGAFGAVNHLRQVVMYLDMAVMQQPEFYLSMAGEKFDENGILTDEKTKKIITEFWKEFRKWIDVIV